MNGVIVDDVVDGMAHFGRSAQRARVKAVGKHRATPVHQPIESLGHSNGKTLHAARQSPLVVGFDDEMQMIALDGKMAKPSVSMSPSSDETFGQGMETATGTEGMNVAPHAHGDVHRQQPKPIPNGMRNARSRLPFAASTNALPAPTASFRKAHLRRQLAP